MALRRARGIVWLAVAALAVAGFSGCGGDEPATTISRTAPMRRPPRQPRRPSSWRRSPRKTFRKSGTFDKIATSFEFNAPTWVQSWLLDGRRWLVDGHNQGSNASYTVQGDHVTMVEPEFQHRAHVRVDAQGRRALPASHLEQSGTGGGAGAADGARARLRPSGQRLTRRRERLNRFLRHSSRPSNRSAGGLRTLSHSILASLPWGADLIRVRAEHATVAFEWP